MRRTGLFFVRVERILVCGRAHAGHKERHCETGRGDVGSAGLLRREYAWRNSAAGGIYRQAAPAPAKGGVPRAR